MSDKNLNFETAQRMEHPSATQTINPAATEPTMSNVDWNVQHLDITPSEIETIQILRDDAHRSIQSASREQKKSKAPKLRSGDDGRGGVTKRMESEGLMSFNEKERLESVLTQQRSMGTQQ